MRNFLVASILIISLQFCISSCETEVDLNEPIVHIKQGTLKGRVAQDYNGHNYFSFQGIPYAKPPLGELRFKSPVPAESWKGTFDATKEGNECAQVDIIQQNIQGGVEDCLILNVYTTELPSKKALKPVMFFIHGGGFTSGSSHTKFYGPEYLVTEDVVVVTINYRLAALGFLSLEDTSLGVSGNAGLKDMVLALKWVRDNIKQFNGDPDNVTIFGESAGSAACNYLMLSESANGLYHRAILQSGVAISFWATGTRNAVEVAKVLGSEASNEQEALEYLKTVPVESFIKAQRLIVDDLAIDHIRPFGPVVEKPGPDAFLTKHPLDLMLAGKYNKVPIIIGHTSREGMLFEVITKLINIETVYRPKDFETEVPYYYNIKKGTELSKTIAKRIEDFYFGVSKTPDEDISKFDILSTDVTFIRGIHVILRALLKTSKEPIYFYRFNIETELNIFKSLGNITRPGACHADDLGYLFKGQLTPEIKTGSQEDIAIKRIVKLWTNFAKNGNPNSLKKSSLIDVEWPQVTSDSFQCLDIDKTFKITTNPDQERVKFWDEISALEGVDSKF